MEYDMKHGKNDKKNMKHEKNDGKVMKHARNDEKGMKHARKPETKEKRKITVKKKTVFTLLGALALIAVITVVVLNFQPIYKFIDTNMTALAGFLSGMGRSGIGSEENKEATDEVENKDIEKDNDTDKDVENGNENDKIEEPEVSDDKEEEKKPGTLPTIKLEIYEGPLYSRAGDVCYYRIKASVTGEPLPEISFSKDDSLGSLGPDKAQVNIARDKKYYVLTAVAENSEGKASDTLTLIWNCNVSPDIKGISLSSSTLYVGKQYDIYVDATDPDNDELSFEWNVEGGSITDNTKNPAKWSTPDTPGDYKISVSVSDGKGNTSDTSITAYIGKITVEEQSSTTSITVPRKEDEGGYIEYDGTTYNGGNVYAGDSASNKPCSGFISFDISELEGGKVQSATLTLSGATVKGDPLSFLKLLNINVLSWGARPIKQDDFKTEGILVAGYDSSNVTCNVSKLKEELQKAVDAGKPRFQIRVHFSGPYTNNNDQDDGWRYSQSNVNLNVTITK